METPPAQPFDDAALKAALKRALGKEHAPESLRQKIAALSGKDASIRIAPSTEPGGSLDEGDRPEVVPLFKKTKWFKFAAAAVLVLGLAGVAFQIYRVTRPPVDDPYALPNSVYNGMVTLHADRRAGKPGTPDIIAPGEFEKAGSLAKQLNRDIFAADFRKEGFEFKGGAIRKIGKHDVAQLFFTKGDVEISLFSLPLEASTSATEGKNYAVVFTGVPVTGFVGKGGIFCAVATSGDKSVTVDTLADLMTKHASAIVSK